MEDDIEDEEGCRWFEDDVHQVHGERRKRQKQCTKQTQCEATVADERKCSAAQSMRQQFRGRSSSSSSWSFVEEEMR